MHGIVRCTDQSEADDRLAITALGHCRMELVASRQLLEKMGMEKLDFTKASKAIPTSFITDEPGGIFRSIYCYHKNKYVTPQMKLLMNLLQKHVGRFS